MGGAPHLTARAPLDSRAIASGPRSVPADSGWHPLLADSELRERKDVSVRVREPGDHRSARRLPDALSVLSHAFVAQKDDAARHEGSNRFGNVRHRPAQNRVRGRIELLHDSHAEHRPVGIEHQREGTPVDELQPECVSVELLGASRVRRGDESDEVEAGEGRI
jgi:hypothetical protein